MGPAHSFEVKFDDFIWLIINNSVG